MNYKFNFKSIPIGDWGLGIGDWGLGIGDWAQSPIPIFNFLIKIIIIILNKRE